MINKRKDRYYLPNGEIDIDGKPISSVTSNTVPAHAA